MTSAKSSTLALKILDHAVKLVELHTIQLHPVDWMFNASGVGLYPVVYLDLVPITRGAGGLSSNARYGRQVAFRFENGEWRLHGQSVHPQLFMKSLLKKHPTQFVHMIRIQSADAGLNPSRLITLYFQTMLGDNRDNYSDRVLANTRARALQTIKWPLREAMAKKLYRPGGPRMLAMMRNAIHNQGNQGNRGNRRAPKRPRGTNASKP